MINNLILKLIATTLVAGADTGVQAPTCAKALHSKPLVAGESQSKSKATDLDVHDDLIRLLESNQFLLNRNFNQYSKLFPFETSPQLFEMLMMMPQNSIWFDMGTGEGNAIVDGLNLFTNFKEGIGLSFKKPLRARVSDEADGRFQYFDGDLVENMSRRGQFDSYKGKVQLITDVFGPLSYSPYLPELFQFYFDLLAPKGILVFTLLVDRNFDSAYETGNTMKLLDSRKAVNSFLVEGLKKEDGLIAWLNSISGIEVIEVVQVPIDKNEFSEKALAVKIRKKSGKVSTPWNLETGHYHATNPPHRIFHIIDDK